MTVRDYVNEALEHLYMGSIFAVIGFFGGLVVLCALLGETAWTGWLGSAFLLTIIYFCARPLWRVGCPFCNAKVLSLVPRCYALPRAMRHLPCCGAKLDQPMPR